MNLTLKGKDMKLGLYLSVIVACTSAASLNGGCKEKDQASLPQSISAQQEEKHSAQITSEQVAATAEQIQPLLTGTKAPAVKLRTVDGKTVNLKDVFSKKSTALVFYRGGWCPYCNTQLGRLKEIEQQILDSGWQIIAISPDRPQKLSESIVKHQMKYILLSDSRMEASKAFGIAFKVDDATIEKYKGYGIDLDDASGESHHLLLVPAVFLIGNDGVIKFTYTNPDYKVRLDPQVLLSEVKAQTSESP